MRPAYPLLPSSFTTIEPSHSRTPPLEGLRAIKMIRGAEDRYRKLSTNSAIYLPSCPRISPKSSTSTAFNPLVMASQEEIADFVAEEYGMYVEAHLQ